MDLVLQMSTCLCNFTHKAFLWVIWPLRKISLLSEEIIRELGEQCSLYNTIISYQLLPTSSVGREHQDSNIDRIKLIGMSANPTLKSSLNLTFSLLRAWREFLDLLIQNRKTIFKLHVKLRCTLRKNKFH